MNVFVSKSSPRSRASRAAKDTTSPAFAFNIFHTSPFSIFLIFIFVFIHGSAVSAVELRSSTILAKSATLLGTRNDYAILEAQFDEELYIREEWPCPCAADSCSQAVSSEPPVDESGLNITQLQENQWYDLALPQDTQGKLFKMQWNAVSGHPCRQMVIEIDRISGSSSAFVSNSYIPRVDQYKWNSVYWGHRRIWLCQSGDKFHYGTFYMLITKQVQSALTLARVRFFFIDAKTCPVPETPPDSDPAWLIKNYQSTGSLVYGDHKLYINSRCASICVAARVAGLAGDVDVFASRYVELPGVHDSEWLSDADGDDTACFSACNETAGATDLTIYIGLETATDAANYSVVADYSILGSPSTFQTSPLPISSLGYMAQPYLFSYGTFRLQCPGLNDILCNFPTYVACETDGYDCCYQIRPLTPTADPTPLWPWDEADVSFESGAVPFNAFQPSVLGKLAWAITLKRYSPNNFFAPISPTFSLEDAQQCQVVLSGFITDQYENPITEPISFVEANLTCSPSRLNDVLERFNQTLTSMYSVSDSATLFQLHHQLNVFVSSKDYLACKSYVESLVSHNASIAALFSDSKSCFLSPSDPGYSTDPCCDTTTALSQCCAPRNVTFPIGAFTNVEETKVQGACSASVCSNKALKSYVDATAAASSLGACGQIIDKVETELRSVDLVSFVYECQLLVAGKDLNGATCSNNASCPSGTCNSGGRCDYSTDDILKCFVDKMPEIVGRFLLQDWGLGAVPLEPTRMIAELKARIVQPQCFGENAIRYRSHYWYHTEIICLDGCAVQGLEPRCFDQTVCDIDPLCARDATPCTRFWEPINANLDACTAQQACNWDACSGMSAADCESLCTNPALSTNVCLLCNEGSTTCTPYENFDTPERCAIGLCKLNESVSDPAECDTYSSCSIACPTCNSELGCIASGVCSDADTVSNFILPAGGVCVEPLTIVDGSVRCANSSLAIPSGCVNTTYEDQSSCQTAGLVWHVLADSQASCAALPSACFGADGTMNLKTQAQCAACKENWSPIYSWTAGVWTRGVMTPLSWQPREFKNTTYVKDSVDFYAFRQMVGNAIFKKFSASVAADAQCRYGSRLKLIEQISCDCTTSENQARGLACYSGEIVAANEGSGWACPFTELQITSRTAELNVFNDSITTSECLVVNLQVISAIQFRLDPTNSGLSSAVFQKQSSNPYSVVTNSEGLYVGQLLSDGVGIVAANAHNLTFDGEVELCIAGNPSISDIDSSYGMYAFATVKSDSSIQPIAGITVSLRGTKYCGRIRSPGVYFATAVTSDWEASSSNGQYIAGGVLYILVGIFSIFQGTIILWHRPMAWQRKIGFIVVILIFQILRAIYLFVSPKVWTQEPLARYVVFEFPQFFYFTVFFSIVYTWSSVINRVSKAGPDVFERRRVLLWKAFLVANAFMYFIFGIFIMLYSVLPDRSIAAARRDPAAVCTVGGIGFQASIQQNNVRVAYKIFIASVCIVCSVTFVAAAAMIVRPLLDFEEYMHKTSGPNAKASFQKNTLQIRRISLLAAVCTAALLTLCIIFLYGAITGGIIPVLVFVFLEVVPTVGFLYYLRTFSLKHPFSDGTDQGTNRTRTQSRTHSGSGTPHGAIIHQ